MNPVLLLVDDDEAIRTQMKWALTADYEIVFAEDRAGAVENFKKKKPAVTLLDLGLPPRPTDPDEGLATLADLKALDEMTKVIVISGQGEKKNAVEAVAAGAYDFLCKPVDPDELKLLLKRCIYLADLEREYRKAKENQRVTVFEDMMGTSPQMQGVFSFIRKVATTTAPVLLLGESGTGKEMAALAIHRRSPRKDGPFVPINCNAIPENLLESELFGHEKGSFTGATMQRAGLIETAAGGTVFLDEIGDLPARLQVKRAVIMSESKRITTSDLELGIPGDSPPATTLKEARENLEREMVQQALKRHLGKISSAANELGISRPTLYELMEKLGISRA